MAQGSVLLIAAIVAAFGALVAALRAVDGRNDVRGARGALGVSACFTAAALGLLIRGLFQVDLTLAYVARHLTTNLASGSRLLALWSDTPGSALAVAAIVSLTGAVAATRPAAIALVSATVTALVAAAISGGALSGLPWTPIEGMGIAPPLQHPLAAVAVLAACLSAVCASVTATIVWNDGARGESASRWTITCFASLLIAAVVQAASARLSGALETAGVMGGPAGIWLVASVTAGWSGLALGRVALPARTRHIAAGATLGGLLAAALAGLGEVVPGPAIQAIAVMALVAAVYSALAWRRAGMPRRLGVPSILVLMALAVLAAVAALGQRRTVVSGEVASGQVAELNGLRLAHQGISRYEAPQAHVLAVALERQSASGARLARAEQREYFDGRGAMVGEVVSPPAVFRGVWRTTYVWLERVEAGDVVRLRSSTVMFETGWWIAVALACLAAVLSWLPRPVNPTAGATPLLCAGCAARAAPGANWCAECGRKLAR